MEHRSCRSCWNRGLLFFIFLTGTAWYMCHDYSCRDGLLVLVDCPLNHSTANLLWDTGMKRCRPRDLALHGLGKQHTPYAHDKIYLLERHQQNDAAFRIRTTPRLLQSHSYSPSRQRQRNSWQVDCNLKKVFQRGLYFFILTHCLPFTVFGIIPVLWRGYFMIMLELSLLWIMQDKMW